MFQAPGFIRLSIVPSMIVLAGLTACNQAPNQANQPATQANQPTQTAAVDNANPADGNLAPADQSAGQPAAQPAPDTSAQAPGTSYSQADYDQNGYAPSGGETVQATDPPPPLPDYSQPPCPGDNYMWTPGYWNYASTGYYWVPGVWVMSPWVGALWTPPYWGYGNGAYIWHTGYWGPHIGFYGGVNYGFGYTGRGYYGAYWNGGNVYYNRSVTTVNETVVHNIYNYSVRNNEGSRVSYNGGRGGIDARPTAQELAVARDPRAAPVAAQMQHAREAAANRAQFASVNHGRPAALVTARPLATSYRAPASRPPASAMRPAARPGPETRAEVQPNQRPAAQAARPAPETRQAAPVRSSAEQRPAGHEQEASRPATEARSAEQRPAVHQQEASRQAAAARPATHPVARATPAERPEARPAEHARPEARPAAASHPAAEAHPEARPAAPRAEEKRREP